MTDISATFPRVDLGFLPTPLEPLDRLSTSLGGPRIWIKRDDCTGLATGGNKTRKLEFLMGDAISLGADTVITYGAVQSNHARQTAAACAKLGFECHLLLSRRVAWQHPEFETSGNVLLDRLLGAHIHFIEPANAEAASRTLINDLTLLGRHCYVIPAGGSNAIGALGYMRCAAEIVAQSRELGFKPDAIVHATSSGGTQAGLVAGLAAENFDCDVIGINVYDTDHAAIESRIEQLLHTTMFLAEVLPNNAPRLRVLHDFIGPDYGIPTQQTTDAIKLLAETEGILTDPVYAGKAFGGLLSMIRKKDFASLSNIIFVHTGGVASLPVYAAAFRSDQR